MKHETKFATVENVVTALCFGVGALLVALALYTLMAVKAVHAEIPKGFLPDTYETASVGETVKAGEPGTFSTVITEEAVR